MHTGQKTTEAFSKSQTDREPKIHQVKKLKSEKIDAEAGKKVQIKVINKQATRKDCPNQSLPLGSQRALFEKPGELYLDSQGPKPFGCPNEAPGLPK